MILECDIGNSRCKWRVIEAAGGLIDSGVLINSEGFGPLAALSYDVTRIRAVSVARPDVAESFQRAVSVGDNVGDVEVEFAVVNPQCEGVQCAYEQPERLGVDRWSAVVAAYRDYGAALVIDVGSALTVDLVDGDGRHLGGYIVPGIELMKSSLLTDTGQVRFDDGDSQGGIGFGASTQRAVNAGVLAAQMGLVDVAIREAEKQVSSGFAILMTGGGAAAVHRYMAGDVIAVPALVLDGLQWLLP